MDRNSNTARLIRASRRIDEMKHEINRITSLIAHHVQKTYTGSSLLPDRRFESKSGSFAAWDVCCNRLQDRTMDTHVVGWVLDGNLMRKVFERSARGSETLFETQFTQQIHDALPLLVDESLNAFPRVRESMKFMFDVADTVTE